MLAHVLCVVGLALAPLERPTDEVLLKDGKTLTGTVVYCDDERLVLVNGSRETRIARDQVESFRAVSVDLRTVLDELDRIQESDAEALLELARYCRDHNLPGESHVLAWGVLAADPQMDEAHELLGHRKRKQRWYVKVGRDEYPADEAARRTADFGDAWLFETTHYRVRTNLGLADAIGIALDLERIYRDVMDFLGPELELQDILEPMHAAVHADAPSFPEMFGGRRSYYYPTTRTLHVNAAQGFERWTLVHEAVHQILNATGDSRTRRRGLSIPGWLDEGLAEYIAAGAQGERGRIHARPGGIALGYFQMHRESDDPYEFSRVLTFGADDYVSTTKQALKYAQSYTLVHFLLHAENQRHRPAFMDYLRSCWDGKSSTTQLKKGLGLSPREVDELWMEYVREFR